MAYKRIFLFLLMVVTAQIMQAQTPVNAYAQVTSISGGLTVLNLGTIEETYDTFENGEFVIVMQMKGASITTGDVSTFGSITSINAAGLYEIATISSHTATSITLTAPLTNTYNTSTGYVQVISYPTMGGGGDYTTTFNIKAKKWTGLIGGVVAFNVAGNLYLSHSVTADSMGLDYGDKYGTAAATADCVGATGFWIKPAGEINAAYKGQGLVDATSSQVCGRAPITNGGGGGVKHNGGGGGGSNFTGGGNGGDGPPGACWFPGTSGKGYGGYALSTYIAINRVFMGGGGGGGHENNGKGTRGGDGGGIVIIEADTIFTSCAGSVKISANASDGRSNKNDGQGGGGGGGSIILFTEYIDADAACSLTVSANGGDGGSVGTDAEHAGGGGGGQGVIFVEAEEMDLMPMDYLTFATTNGIGGANCSTATCDSAQDGDGLDDSGIFFGETPLLPVNLLTFQALVVNNSLVNLEWVTASEISCDHFELYRSGDAEQWEQIAQIRGNGTTNTNSYYTWPDDAPLQGWNYYVLKQVDENGFGVYSKVVQVFLNATTADLYVYPNPVINQTISIHSGEDLQGAAIALFNLQGQRIPVSIQSSSEHDLTVQTDVLPAGYYLLTIKTVQGNIVSYTLLAE